jgi:hypothetical protein
MVEITSHSLRLVDCSSLQTTISFPVRHAVKEWLQLIWCRITCTQRLVLLVMNSHVFFKTESHHLTYSVP